jgi:hypothetical protein
MANFRRLFSITIVISLLLSIGVLFISQLATAGDVEGKPEESTLYEASKSWDGGEPYIDVDQDYLDFACSVGGSTPNMAATLNQLDFECTTPTLSSYKTSPISDKIEMMLINSPPTPPVNVSRTIANVGHLTASAVILNDVPTSEWTYGCTATSAGMLFGYYDRTGYPNMYTGPTNGGVCPLTDLGQGIPTNPRYPIPGSCYIISTENGLDGISSNAHVDDYWISYGSAGPDPWEGNWPEHTWELCTADFLGTNQWKWDYSSYPATDGTIDVNKDGSTNYWYMGDGSKLHDWCPGPAYGIPTTSCCHGMRLFAESRGYSVEANYNQITDNQHPNGFTFPEFQAEIDAERPVLIHVRGVTTGHTMVGIGYDTATDSIYIHDTWDNDVHNMTWGGSYADMDLRAITVIHLASPTEYSLTISSTSGGNVTTPGEGTFTYDEGTVVDLVAAPDAGFRFVNWTGNVSTICNVTAATTNITMNGNYAITANSVALYDLTIDSTVGGNVTTPGEGLFPDYDAGTVGDLVATPDTGYRFVNWTGNVSTICNVTTATTNITMNGNYAITANFVALYDLTIDSTVGGNVTTPGEGLFPDYDAGTVVDLVATPDANYRFDEWTGDVGTIADVDAGTTTITMNGDYSVAANFEEVPSSPEGCFIATAAYGTPMAEEIEILREFRDEYLVTNPLGRNFVGFYYTVSPPIAEFITEHPSLKLIVRAGLVPAVTMSTIAVNTTMAEKTAIVGLLVLVSVAVAIWVMRRRHRDPEYA